MMKTKFIPFIIVFACVLIAVCIKSIPGRHFRNDAGKHAVLSVDHSNLVTKTSLNNLKGNNLFLQIDNVQVPTYSNEIALSSEQVLDRHYLGIINKHKGNIILISEDKAKAARIWMLLAQMGIKNLYILQ